MQASSSSPPRSSAPISPRNRGCFSGTSPKKADHQSSKAPASPQPNSPIQNSSPLRYLSFLLSSPTPTLKGDKLEVFLKELTAENVASAYDSSRHFSSFPNSNQLKLLLRHLNEVYATPFLLPVGEEEVLFLDEKDNDKLFRLVKIEDISISSLTQKPFLSLGTPIDSSSALKINLRLGQVQCFHSMSFGIDSLPIDIYPSQNNTTQKSILTLTVSLNKSDLSIEASSFPSSFKEGIEEIKSQNKALSCFQKSIRKDSKENPQMVLTFEFSETKGNSHQSLKDILSACVKVKNTNAGIEFVNIKLFSTPFYKALNPEKKSSKIELFDSIDPSLFKEIDTQESLSQRKEDGSYPGGIFLENPSSQLIENTKAWIKPSGSKLYMNGHECFILLSKPSNCTPILDPIAIDATSRVYAYAMYIPPKS